jgi:hypothetical protein
MDYPPFSLVSGFYNLCRREKTEEIYRATLTADLPGAIVSRMSSMPGVQWVVSHCLRVSCLATDIWLDVQPNPGSAFQVCRAGMYHDVGKLDIPPSILNKPGKLTGDEWNIMKTHVAGSVREIADRDDEAVINAVAFHHADKRSGPYAAIRNRIVHPSEAGAGRAGHGPMSKCVSVADVFDSLLFPRTYKGSIPVGLIPEYVREELSDDPVLERFINAGCARLPLAGEELPYGIVMEPLVSAGWVAAPV